MPTIIAERHAVAAKLQELLGRPSPTSAGRRTTTRCMLAAWPPLRAHARRRPVVRRALHQVDEHVLEPGVDAAAISIAASCGRLAQRSLEQRTVLAGDVNRLAERHGLLHARHRAQALGKAREVGAAHLERGQPLLGDDFARRALREQAPVRDVGELVAALGLVHVVRADEHRDALRREPVQLFPEFAPRIGIDARGRLVEQQKARPMQHARASASRCFHPPDSVPVSWSRRLASPRSSSALSTAARRSLHLVHTRGELEVLADRQVVPEREALRHVADVALDRRGLRCRMS